MSVDVSVIIPVKNGEQWLGDQLAALAAQDFAGTWEVVVADNGSTDGTRQLVERMAADFPAPLRVADASTRPGISHARNSGAIASTGKLLAFCDCDDRVAQGWLDAAWRAHERGEVVAGLNRERTEPQDPNSPVLNPGAVIRGTRIDAFIGCNFAVRRDAYFAVGGFDESLPPYGCDDIEFSVRIAKAGMDVVGAEDMVVYFRKTEGTRAILRKVYLSAKAEVVLWYRHIEQFHDRVGLSRSAREFARLPFDVVRGLVRRDRDLKWIARDIVSRWGHLMSEMEWRRGVYQREADLLAPETTA